MEMLAMEDRGFHLDLPPAFQGVPSEFLTALGPDLGHYEPVLLVLVLPELDPVGIAIVKVEAPKAEGIFIAENSF